MLGELWSTVSPALVRFLPALALAAVCLGALLALRAVMLKRRPADTDNQLPRQATLLALTGVAAVLLILSLPVADSTRNQLLAVLGLLLTAVIALSSTTLVSNVMAGLMLRAVQSFKPGDFIHVGDDFGRVTELGLFHTEIQSEDRDLTTLPNSLLASQPVRVVRSSGTIVSASVSLGYDVDHAAVDGLLCQAAVNAGLKDPFVLIQDLGDFSVGYRIAGFLTEPKHLLSARSGLRREMLDQLHGGGIEIVSPNFMNQRQLGDGERVIPAPSGPRRGTPDQGRVEALVFDKAERAGELQALRDMQSELTALTADLEKRLSSAPEQDRAALERELAATHNRARALARTLESVPVPEDD